MIDRLPWFRCFPSPLLGAIAGMLPDEGYVYIVVLMRIYETGSPVFETGRTMSRRTGLSERRVTTALDTLFTTNKLTKLADGRIDSASTHDEITWQNDRRASASRAGKVSAETRVVKNNSECEIRGSEKNQQNQQINPTTVERSFNYIDLEKDISPSLRSGDMANTKSKRGTRLTPDWKPSEKDAREAIDLLGRDSAKFELSRFRDWAMAAPGQKGVKLDWNAAWRLWYRGEVKKLRAYNKKPESGIESLLRKNIESRNGDFDDQPNFEYIERPPSSDGLSNGSGTGKDIIIIDGSRQTNGGDSVGSGPTTGAKGTSDVQAILSVMLPRAPRS